MATPRDVAGYVLLEPLGDGNHGSYWRARPPARLGIDDDVVRLKLLHAEGGDEAFRRMVRELRAMARLSSPHLVQLLDAGHDRGRLYHAERDPGGGSLARPEVTVDARGLVRAVADAARGAHALHEAGIAHRDITPATVLLHADGRGLLSDLGLVQVLGEGRTTTGAGPIGAMAYTDPAVVRGERASRATDLWSLGAVLHEAVTGASIQPGLAGMDLLAALRRVVTEPPTLHAALPPALAPLVARCFAPEPAERFATAEAFADALDATMVVAA